MPTGSLHQIMCQIPIGSLYHLDMDQTHKSCNRSLLYDISWVPWQIYLSFVYLSIWLRYYVTRPFCRVLNNHVNSLMRCDGGRVKNDVFYHVGFCIRCLLCCWVVLNKINHSLWNPMSSTHRGFKIILLLSFSFSSGKFEILIILSIVKIFKNLKRHYIGNSSWQNSYLIGCCSLFVSLSWGGT